MLPPRRASLIAPGEQGPGSTWVRLLQGDFTLRLPQGLAWRCPGGTDGRVLGGSLGPDLEEMQRECCGNARYEQCKEAVNLDRKIRKGFPEEGLREKGD